jgi:hypothetical protein
MSFLNNPFNLGVTTNIIILCHIDPDTFEVQNPTTIGIIGGGQLGKMIAQEASECHLRS